MSIFDRLFRIGKAEANAAVDKIEDPAKMAAQILRELKENYQQAIQGEAEIKALALQHRANELQYRNTASDWEKKANDLLDRVDSKQLDEAKGKRVHFWQILLSLTLILVAPFTVLSMSFPCAAETAPSIDSTANLAVAGWMGKNGLSF